MPPSGFNKKAVEGLLMFVDGCYEDLQAEVQSGKHESVEAAIKFERRQLDKAIASIHINKDGKLVKCSKP